MHFPAYLLSKAGAVIRPAVVELSDTDLPEGEVLVRVEWSAINFKDAMVTRPGNRVARVFPLVPGVELTGIVEESTSPEFTPGQRVLVQGYDLGVDRHGGFAAYARVPADWVVPLPDALTCRTAAIIGLAGCTALLSLRRLVHHGTTPEDGPILVTGASGGVGSAAVALLAHAGFEVVASSGKTTEHEYLKDLGASRVVGREFTEDDGRTLGPQLWAGVVDCVGGRALAEALRTVRYGGAVRGQRADRWQRSGDDGLSVHCARASPCWGSTPCPLPSRSGASSGPRWPTPSRCSTARRWSTRRSGWTG